MSNEKGVLSKLAQKVIRDVGDAAIEAKGLIEAFDGPAIAGALTIIDDVILDKYLKDEQLKTSLRALVDELLVEKDIDVATDLAVEIQQRVLNIPGFDDAIEKEIVHGMLKIAFGLLVKVL